MRALLVLALIAQLHCTTSETSTETSTETSGDETVEATGVTPPYTTSNAPYPYTAEQIREANPDGRAIVLEVTTPAGVRTQTMTFREGDAVGATIDTVVREGETVVTEASERATWTELREHAAFPAAQTVIDEVTVEGPLGAIPARRYTVTRDDGTTSIFWFAQDPTWAGPPVRLEERRGDEVLVTLVMLGR